MKMFYNWIPIGNPIIPISNLTSEIWYIFSIALQNYRVLLILLTSCQPLTVILPSAGPE